MFYHAIEGFIGPFGMFNPNDLDLIELMQAVQAANMCAIAARFPSKTRGIGRIAQWEVGLLQDHIAE